MSNTPSLLDEFEGVGNNIKIYKQKDISMLFNMDKTPSEKLGFTKNLKGINDNKAIFEKEESNTNKVNILDIEKSFFMPTLNNVYNNYLIYKLKSGHIYKKGDVIYINNHKLRGDIVKSIKTNNLNIKSIEPVVLGLIVYRK